MIIFSPVLTTETQEEPIIPKYNGTRMSLNDFINFEPEESGIKYEWDNGILEAEATLKKEERFILDNILRKFNQTSSYKEGGNILTEANIFLDKIQKLRKPDASFFTKEQMRKQEALDIVPGFIIEIISPSNSSIEVEQKIKDYFNSGVKVIWYIFPTLKEVKVYTSMKNVNICMGQDICDVGEVIPELQMTVDEIFHL